MLTEGSAGFREMGREFVAELSGDLEPALTEGVLFVHVHRFHPRPSRTLTAPLDHRVHRLRVTLEGGLDPPVRKVAHEASQASPGRFFPAVPAEPDPLDVSRDEDPHALGDHRATV